MSKRLPFYIMDYGHYIAYTTYFTERQGVKNYLFLYTLSGMGTIKYLDKDYTLQPGQAVVIYCDNYHEYKTLSSENWDFLWFHFSGTAAKEYCKLLNKSALSVVNIKDNIDFERMVKDLFASMGSSDIASCVTTSMYATNIMTRLITDCIDNSDNQKFVEHKKDIETVIRFIQENFSNKVNIEEMAKIASMSKYHFLRVFKSHMGVSPYDYLLQYRISRAKELLKTTDFSVGEICTLSGFYDYNHFIRVFKREMGTTPAKYRTTA